MEYLVARVLKNDLIYGNKHASHDAISTLCGKSITELHYIMDFTFDNVDCPRCLNAIRKEKKKRDAAD